MNILYLAPEAPPITGQSIAAKVLYDHLNLNHDVNFIDLSLASKHDGSITLSRVFQVIKTIYLIRNCAKKADYIYLTISESIAGNIKDLFIYLVCKKKFSKFYIHLHGGSIKKHVFDKSFILRKLNHIVIEKLAGVFVSGESHKHIFSSMVEEKKLHIVRNFAEDYMFYNKELVKKKFLSCYPLKIVYVSGMTTGKGYLYLLKAFKEMSNEVKKVVQIDFAGKFDTPEEQSKFESQILEEKNINYHGIVDNDYKKTLFSAAHIFCLPTTFLEGQPISILEAYASGCVVMATGQPGILDIFSNNINGYEIQKNDYLSIKNTIEKLVSKPNVLSNIACNNFNLAESSYRTNVFVNSVSKVVLS
jgi:glycosyltransferase involved in cell wall biosynthesis